MEDLFGINAHRQSVQENIEKAFDLGFDADNNIEGIEKAKHQVGDIHPNGRWVWTEYAPGKFDWKSLRGKHHKGNTQQNSEESVKKTSNADVDNFMDKVKTFSNKYSDESKITVEKTPKGNWDVSYDGHRLGIINANQLSEKTAKEKGWLKEEKQEDNRKLSELVKNDTVAVVMERYNPQLGNYVTIERGTIDRVNKNSFSVTAGMITRKFDKQSGKRTDYSTDVYGSSTYSILTEKELNNKIKDGKFNGSRISRNAFENGKS